MTKKTIEMLLREVNNSKNRKITQEVKRKYLDEEVWIAKLDFKTLEQVEKQFTCNRIDKTQENLFQTYSPYRNILTIASSINPQNNTISSEIAHIVLEKFIKPLSIIYQHTSEWEEEL